MHRTKKSLGQHFLHETGIVERILRAVDPRPGQRMVEIGPGTGALTLPLLERVGALIAIEFDRDLIAPLETAARGHGDLSLVHADVLDVDFSVLAAGQSVRVVGNLPYNLSSPILFHCLDQAEVIEDMHFMLQREVVERMAAAPGSKVYGRLSVMLQAACEVTPLFRVPPGAFRPPPKVDSAVVRLRPRATTGVTDPALFADLVREAFGQRRKTLRNALARLCPTPVLAAAGIDPGARAETLSVADFRRLADTLASSPTTRGTLGP